MSLLAIILLSLLALLILLGLWFISGYNALVHFKAMLDEAWSGINVQLKRRYDLIPNLVAVVKQYSVHEKDVLENVTRLRSTAMQATSIEEKSKIEASLSSTLKTLFAVAENYPELKANENFLSLQNDLRALEEELQLSRRYYNGAARNYNVKVQTFPSSIIATLTGFTAATYFELESSEERNVPHIQF